MKPIIRTSNSTKFILASLIAISVIPTFASVSYADWMDSSMHTPVVSLGNPMAQPMVNAWNAAHPTWPTVTTGMALEPQIQFQHQIDYRNSLTNITANAFGQIMSAQQMIITNNGINRAIGIIDQVVPNQLTGALYKIEVYEDANGGIVVRDPILIGSGATPLQAAQNPAESGFQPARPDPQH